MAKVRNYNGQEAVEFILISALVFFACLGVLMLFGNKMGAFFNNDSSVVKTASQKVNVISGSTPGKYGGDGTTGGSQITVGPYTGTKNADGSVTYKIGGQDVVITQSMSDLSNTVFQTTGSGANLDFLKALETIIAENKTGSDPVTVDIFFGNSNRHMSGGNYSGTAQTSSVSLKVGSNFIVLAKDQQCNGNDSSCSYSGEYTIKGSAYGTNKFKADVTGNLDNGNTVAGGISSGVYNPGSFNGQFKIDGQDCDWNLNFDQADYHYQI